MKHSFIYSFLILLFPLFSNAIAWPDGAIKLDRCGDNVAKSTSPVRVEKVCVGKVSVVKDANGISENLLFEGKMVLKLSYSDGIDIYRVAANDLPGHLSGFSLTTPFQTYLVDVEPFTDKTGNYEEIKTMHLGTHALVQYSTSQQAGGDPQLVSDDLSLDVTLSEEIFYAQKKGN